MVVKTKTTCGNFAIEAEAEVTEAQAAILADAGFLQELQRSPVSAAEKRMAGYDKRPAGFKRNSIAFSDANATILTEELSKPIVIADGVTIVPTVVVSEHVPGQGAEPKYKAAKDLYAAKGTTPDRLAKLAELVEYDGEVGEGTGHEAPEEFILAIHAWFKKA